MTTKKMSSRHSKAVAHMNSQSLRQCVTRPSSAQASDTPSMKRSGHKVPPLAEEPLAIDNFWENQFSVRVWPLLDLPQSSGKPHWIESMNPRIHEHHKLDLLWVKEREKEEDTKLVMKGSRMNFGRVARDGVNVIKMYCKKFSGTIKRFTF